MKLSDGEGPASEATDSFFIIHHYISSFIITFHHSLLHFFNSFTAVLAAPSLEKRPTEVPKFEMIKTFPPLRLSTWKDFYQNAQY